MLLQRKYICRTFVTDNQSGYQKQTNNNFMNNLLMTKLVEKQTPFAIIQYFEFLKLAPLNKYKKYSIHYLDEHNELTYQELSDIEVEKFKNNLELFTIVQEDENGKVYEFMNFKNYHDNNVETKRI